MGMFGRGRDMRHFNPTSQQSSRWRAAVAAGLVAAVMVLTDLGGDGLRTALMLESDAVFRGEVWRLFTAHLTSLGPLHTWMNVAALAVLFIALWPVFTLSAFASVLLASAIAVGIGWLVLVPPGSSYVGFSGVVHGLLAYGALTALVVGPRWLGLVLSTMLVMKLGYELVNGPLPGVEQYIGGEVSTLSHALGALGGTLAATRVPAGLRLVVALSYLALSVFEAPTVVLQF